ncbi:protein-S-isoprenylcysteine O-methyltransferase [Pseudonocardia sp. MH-G8]|uniref:protein-S-isoprenylcysteine O-methyltransferase n=1 Tax=Pseudonocardia sp. MH-G8 TaxID=1854588 RepID=UPI000B9FA3B4|nr:protein-S-isoprenylcysteine O-methyltransferase [Pseudonocardia sp. MH-G8]OZM76545.1 protein-S-isoprenylcysteine methyltransferase [Pseudonocardia sp. MH-G8]
MVGDVVKQQGILKIVYGAGWVLIALIRLPARRRARSASVVVDRKTAAELSHLALLSVGMGVLPLIHLSTRWLRFADRRLPSWAGWTGAASQAAGVWLLWRAHAELGRYWSDSVQLRQGHQLVTGGIYRHVRHPMYAAGWLLGIAQALLLQNRVAGPAGPVSFALLCRSRVPREEQMMLEQFGEQYRAYMERTGRIFPKRSP